MNEAIRWQLINATLNGDSQRLRSLLSKQVRIDFVQACQLFHLAAACGSTDNLKTLLAFMPSINVNSRDEVGCTALHKAASAGHREIIHFLIYHGAQIDVREYLYGNSPLHEVASKGFSRSVEALCISRAPPNLQNKLGLTPLHVAAQNGHKQSIRVLLFSGADLGVTDKFGDTCLHTAVRYNRTGVVKILLAASANVMATNRNLDTPLHIAASLKRTKIARCLLAADTGRKSVPVMDTLTRMSGGDLRKQTSSPLSSQPQPLPSAVQTALWMRNVQGETPLEVAKRRLRSSSGDSNSDMITLLLDRMNVAECCSHYENGTTKSFPRLSASGGDGGGGGNESDALLATPYMSTDLIYSPVQKKTTFRFAFKNRKSPKGPTAVVLNCNSFPNRQIHQEFKSSNKDQTISATNRLHCPQTIAADSMSTSCMNETTAENPAYLSGGLRTKPRSFRRSLLGGLFKREHVSSLSVAAFNFSMFKESVDRIHRRSKVLTPQSKSRSFVGKNQLLGQKVQCKMNGCSHRSGATFYYFLKRCGMDEWMHHMGCATSVKLLISGKANLHVLAGEMKKSESSQLPASGISNFAGSTEKPLLKMPTSISVSEALNESLSSSFTGRSVLQEISLSTDDPPQDSLLLGRFQQLPLPQNSESTSVRLSNAHLPEDVMTTNSCSDRDRIPSHPISPPHPNPTACASLSGCVNRSSGGGVGGSGERTRPRFVVRFDLDVGSDTHADPASVADGRQLSVQLYRDLAGNLKKGPAGFPSGCNCIQRQTDYFAGKVPDFVPCATHSYLEFRAPSVDLQNSNLPGTRKSRPGRAGTANATAAMGKKQWMRSRSDESLSISGRVGSEPPTSSAPPTKPVAMEKNLSSADPLSDMCIRNSNGRPVSVIWEDVTGWPPSEHQIQPTLSNGEESQESASQQTITKSKSYSGHIASAVDTTATRAPNGDLINAKMKHQVARMTPLYMSCRNIGGKMGLSVGRFAPAPPTPMPANGAR